MVVVGDAALSCLHTRGWGSCGQEQHHPLCWGADGVWVAGWWPEVVGRTRGERGGAGPSSSSSPYPGARRRPHRPGPGRPRRPVPVVPVTVVPTRLGWWNASPPPTSPSTLRDRVLRIPNGCWGRGVIDGGGGRPIKCEHAGSRLSGKWEVGTPPICGPVAGDRSRARRLAFGLGDG
jgi:hypothetical protein